MVNENLLAELRAEITEALRAAGFKTQDYFTTKVIPPVAIVIPDDPFIQTPDDPTMTEQFQVNFNVMVLVLNQLTLMRQRKWMF